MTQRLTTEQLQEAVVGLEQWTLGPERGGVLSREFAFSDFVQAFGFMTQVALHAEKRDHHPEWSNVYHRVWVVLTTHDANGITGKDIELAHFMDHIATGFPDKGLTKRGGE